MAAINVVRFRVQPGRAWTHDRDAQFEDLGPGLGVTDAISGQVALLLK